MFECLLSNMHLMLRVLALGVQMEVVSSEVHTALAGTGIKSALYWGHETAPGRLVAIQRLALAAGVAWLHDATHLSLHSDHG